MAKKSLDEIKINMEGLSLVFTARVCLMDPLLDGEAEDARVTLSELAELKSELEDGSTCPINAKLVVFADQGVPEIAEVLERLKSECESRDIYFDDTSIFNK